MLLARFYLSSVTLALVLRYLQVYANWVQHFTQKIRLGPSWSTGYINDSMPGIDSSLWCDWSSAKQEGELSDARFNRPETPKSCDFGSQCFGYSVEKTELFKIAEWRRSPQGWLRLGVSLFLALSSTEEAGSEYD